MIPLPYIVSLNVAFWYWPVGQASKMPAVRKFREWLLEEAKNEERVPNNLTELRATGFLS